MAKNKFLAAVQVCAVFCCVERAFHTNLVLVAPPRSSPSITGRPRGWGLNISCLESKGGGNTNSPLITCVSSVKSYFCSDLKKCGLTDDDADSLRTCFETVSSDVSKIKKM